MVELFKIINGCASTIMEDFFLFHENTHNIRNFQIISNESMVKYRTPLNLKHLYTVLKLKLKHGNVKHVFVSNARSINKIRHFYK